MLQKQTSRALLGRNELRTLCRRWSLRLLAFLAVLMAIGCGQPPYTAEFYGAQVSGSESPVKLMTTRWGPLESPGRYTRGPVVRFEGPDGVIWELWVRYRDPKFWTLLRVDQSGQAEEVPIQLLNPERQTVSDHHPEHWPRLQYPDGF